MKIVREYEISDTDLQDLLCCAFEGGSNYWYKICGYEFAPGDDYQDFRDGGKYTQPDRYYHPSQIIPLHGTVCIQDTQNDKSPVYRLDRDALRRGMELMAKNHHYHFFNVLAEATDAITGDVFLQLCLFGEVVY